MIKAADWWNKGHSCCLDLLQTQHIEKTLPKEFVVNDMDIDRISLQIHMLLTRLDKLHHDQSLPHINMVNNENFSELPSSPELCVQSSENQKSQLPYLPDHLRCDYLSNMIDIGDII